MTSFNMVQEIAILRANIKIKGFIKPTVRQEVLHLFNAEFGKMLLKLAGFFKKA
jgi:hypothetical protein